MSPNTGEPMRIFLAILCVAAAVTAACDTHGPIVGEERPSPEYAVAFTRALFDYDVFYSARLWIYLPDSDTSFALTPDSLWPEVFEPQWSPDGTSILYYFGVSGGPLSLWTVDTRTKRHRMIYEDGCEVHSADWSPDGTRIVFLSDCEPQRRNAQSTLHIVDVESGAVEDLREITDNIASPRWSPDGRQLLVAGTVQRNETGRRGLWLRSGPDDSWNPLFMTLGTIRDAAWSPDATRVAFALASGEVLVINAEQPNATRTLSTEDWNRWPTWSPDGSMLAFRRMSTLRVVDFSGQLWGIYGALYNNAPPSWSPDGSRIILSARHGIDEIDVRSGDVTNLIAERSVGFWSASWSPLPWNEIQSTAPERK